MHTAKKKVRHCCPKVFKSFLKGEKFIWFEKIVYVQETISKELRRPLVWLVQDETWCVFKGRYYFCSFSSHLLRLQKSLSCVSAVISLLIDCICVLDSWLDNMGLLKASSLVWRCQAISKDFAEKTEQSTQARSKNNPVQLFWCWTAKLKLLQGIRAVRKPREGPRGSCGWAWRGWGGRRSCLNARYKLSEGKRWSNSTFCVMWGCI